MNRLPIEVENKIWKLYWMDIFKTNCINYFKQEEDKLLKLDFFIKKHLFPTESNTYLKQIKFYLIQYHHRYIVIRTNFYSLYIKIYNIFY